MSKYVGSSAVLVSFAMVMGCSSSSGGTTGNGTPETGTASLSDYCSSICTHVNTCDSSHDVQTCSSQCTNVNAAGFPLLRGDVVRAAEDCEKNTDCAQVLSGAAETQCIDTAVAQVSPTAAATSFCDAYSAAATKCGVTIDYAACLNDHKGFNDAALADAQSCTSKSCSDVPGCVNVAFGATSTPTKTSALRITPVAW